MSIPFINEDTRREIAERKTSVYSLLAVNLFPLVGVLVFHWRAFDVVFLYWMENVIIGAVNVLKILTCAPDPELLAETVEEKIESMRGQELTEEQEQQIEQFRQQLLGKGSQAGVQLSKLFFAPFFAVHYGLFCLVHGVFVCVLLGGGGPFGSGMNDPFEIAAQALHSPAILLGALILAASHLISYFTNFIGRGEYRRTAPPLLMVQPYARIVVLHIAILASGFITVIFGSPIVLLVLLIAGKTLLDLKLHLREHKEDPEPGVIVR